MNSTTQDRKSTVVRATVHSADHRVYDVGLYGHIDSSPERTDFSLTVTDGSPEDFSKWFLEVADGVVAYGKPLVLRFADLGSPRWKFENGEVIEISFDEFFEHWLNREVAFAKNEIRIAALEACKALEINDVAT